MNEPILEFKGPYFFLSNFYPSAFVYLGLKWPTSEHAFQAMKTLDSRQWFKVAALPTASEAKNYGRHNIALRSDWEQVKLTFMKEVVRAKFVKASLKSKLVSTGSWYLSEGNWHGDDYWGYCFKTKQGRNELGRILMEVRCELIS